MTQHASPSKGPWQSKPLDLAWAAGFYDGEGSVSFRKPHAKTKANVAISITQKDPELLHRWAAILRDHGIQPGVVGEPRHLQGTRQLQVFGFERVQMAMCILWPWLGTVKRRQFARAMWTLLSHRDDPFYRLKGRLCRKGHDDWLMTKRGRICRTCRNASNRDARSRRSSAIQ